MRLISITAFYHPLPDGGRMAVTEITSDPAEFRARHARCDYFKEIDVDSLLPIDPRHPAYQV